MWSFQIRNIGGIRDGEASVQPGINVVQADNWQGKSSFITSIQTVMGTTGMDGSGHPLTEGASNGEVTLQTEDRTYSTTLARDGRTVTREGDTYLTDSEDRVCARLFAFLGEDNPVRAAVREDGDLADLLVRPLDLEDIDERIANLKQERRAVEQELEQARQAAERIPGVQEAVTQLEQELETLQEEYAALEAEHEGSDDQADLRDELSDKRSRRNQLQGDVTRLENTIERKGSRLEQKRQKLDELDVPDELEVEADVDEKRERVAELRQQIEILEDVHGANKRVLDEDQFHLVSDVERSLTGDEVTCWTCGTASTKAEFEESLSELQTKIRDLRSEREALESEVEKIQRRQQEFERKRREQQRLKREVGELETDLDDSRRDLEDREEQLSVLEDEIAELDETVEEADDRLADLKSDILVKERDLERKEEQLEELEAQRADETELEARYDELGKEIANLRDRKKNKQREIAEQFETAMDDVIAKFEPGFENARLEPRTDASDEIVDFDLIVAREGREASLDALSEGELEILGIVAALAGYKTFDVAAQVPVILLDDVGGLSSRRIQSLVEYLDEEADYLVTTAYPEAGDFRGHTISPGEWSVVSDRTSASS